MNASNTGIWTQKQKERQKALRQSGDKVKTFPSRQSLLRVLTLAFLLSASLFGVFFYNNYHANPALEISGNTIFVKAGGDFQAALNQSKPGDTILLQAGATFKGTFNLPRKTGGEFIIVRTSAEDELLPRAGTRINPTKYASILPKLVSPVAEPVITAFDGAHHYRFIGIEFGATKNGIGNIIKLGTGEEKRIEDLPHHIEFDRVYIHGSPTEGQRRGIAANGKHIRILNSHISDIKRKGEESQAITVWATDGPVEIINNYLEAAAENILFGGGTSFLNLVPTDCVVRGNHLNKPLNWHEEGWGVKNLFEIKNARRIKIENNLMTNNWGHAQDGTAVVFKSSDDSGDQAVAEDIEFVNNIVRGSGNGIGLNGSKMRGGRRLTIRNNLFEDIDAQKWNGGGFFMKSSAWDGLIIENNTIINSGAISRAYEAPVRGFVFRNNIIFENEYGFKGDGTPSGTVTIDKYFPAGDVSFNAIVGGDIARYRTGNFYPVSIRQIGFVDAEGGDYQLRPDSPLQGKGFGGKQIGANLDSKNFTGAK
jgi:hypothetical protein